jgi:predicted RNA-binding protein with PIN domain
MRILIDGYNLMHAVNLPSTEVGPQVMRKLRRAFLNDLAAALGPVDAAQTVVVFDATNAPEHLPKESQHKGLTVIFAAEDESADDRLEALIGQHSAPKTLTVVSSDRRVRQAAQRRRAQALGADEFWTKIHARPKRPVPPPHPRPQQTPLTPEESAYWMETFREVVEDPATHEALRPADFVPTDEEIARIEREVEEES